MRSKGGAICVLIALIAIVCAPGCGGSGDISGTSQSSSSGAATTSRGGDEAQASDQTDRDDSVPDEMLTKEALIEQGDEICRRADKAQEGALKDFLKDKPNSQGSAAGRAETVEQAGLPPIKVEVDELAALGAPQGDEAEVEAIIEGIERAIEEGEAKPLSLLSSTNPFVEVGKLAKKYGFKACSRPL